jgi:hypothetical protein
LASHYRDYAGNDLAVYRSESQALLSQWNEPGSGYVAWVIIP